MIASAILADSLAMVAAGMPRSGALAEAFAMHTTHLAQPVREALRQLLLGA